LQAGQRKTRHQKTESGGKGEMIGARMGAEHQPQRVESFAASDQFENVGLAKLLRLVGNTVALRSQVTTYASNENQTKNH
jgi:hypothetical protein